MYKGTKSYYKKKWKSRRPRKSRPKSNTFWGNSVGLAKTALKTAKWVAGLVNAEYKYFETDQNASTTYNGSMYNLCAPAQGGSVIQRDGDSVKMIKLTINGQINYATTPEIVRIIIFIDKEAVIGATPGNLLESVGSGTVVRANKNQDYKFDSKILLDRSYVLDTYHPLRKFKYVIPLKIHQHFTAGSTTVKNNGLTIAIFGQTAAAAGTFSFHSHVSYVDN